ncbi:MAG: hypothetical protein QXR60_03760, partial [Candidatus Nanoarchaeia archaeon]
ADTARELNTQLHGYIGFFIVVVVWFVMFLALRDRGQSVKASFAATAFVNAIVVILLYPLGIVHPTLFWASLVLPAVGIFLLYVLTDF